MEFAKEAKFGVHDTTLTLSPKPLNVYPLISMKTYIPCQAAVPSTQANHLLLQNK